MTELKQPSRRIAVLGGGISGLAAAYTLARARQAGAPIEELLIEASGRLGGVVQTEQVEGFVIEGGPDSFLAEKPEAAALARELGLGDALIGSNDSERRTYILHRGRLVPLPDGLLLLVPMRFWPVVTTRLLPLRSKLSLMAEWFRSPSPHEENADESVASFVRRHFGEAMLENIADPLLAGVYGGDSERLSVRSVLPRFWEMERKYGSLTRAALESRRRAREDSKTGPPEKKPLFMTLVGGLGQLIEKLKEQLPEARVRLGQRVIGIDPRHANRPGVTEPDSCAYIIRCEGGTSYDADAVILAMPTHECSRLVSAFAPQVGELLRGIPYSSAVTVALAYGSEPLRRLPPGFGFLVPRKEKKQLLACTFVHNKFNERVPEGKALLRCFLGGTRDSEAVNLGDDEMVSIVREELKEILNLSAEPLFHRIHRWPDSMAQYVVGHAARLKAIETQLEKNPDLFPAGNAYSGIGLSDCIRSGRAAAERALRYFSLA